MTLTLNRTSVTLAFGIALLSPALAPAQINQGQVDMFETGTTLNWGIGPGGFSGPTVQPGGPGGASDHYLQLISGQSGGPPRWVVFNDVQWTGNYNTPATSDSSVRSSAELAEGGVSSPVTPVRSDR